MGAVQFIEHLDRTTLTISDDEFEKNVEAAVSAIAEKHAAESPTLTQRPQFQYNEKHPPPGSSMDGQGSSARASFENEGQENPAITGLLKSFGKPLTTIGRMFTEEAGSSQDQYQHQQQQHDQPPPQPPRPGDRSQPSAKEALETLSRTSSRHTLSAEEAAARQASAEAAEAQRLQRAEHANVVETLCSMFPDLDKDIISDVVHQKEGR